MSTTLSRKKPLKLDVNRPFDAKTIRRAKAIASRYHVVLWYEEGTWFGRGLELPWSFGDGRTPNTAVKDTRQALMVTVASMIESGDPIPKPSDAVLNRRKAG